MTNYDNFWQMHAIERNEMFYQLSFMDFRINCSWQMRSCKKEKKRKENKALEIDKFV